MSDHVHRIIMSKRVASRFLEEISRSGRAITVFFPVGSSQDSFVKTASDLGNSHVTCGFDQATFVSTDNEVMSGVIRLAEQRDFDWTDL